MKTGNLKWHGPSPEITLHPQHDSEFIELVTLLKRLPDCREYAAGLREGILARPEVRKSLGLNLAGSIRGAADTFHASTPSADYLYAILRQHENGEIIADQLVGMILSIPEIKDSLWPQGQPKLRLAE